MPLLGYFISFHTYGTWLHGDAKGSVDDEHCIPGTRLVQPNPARVGFERKLMANDAVSLDAERRYVVDATIREVCAFRGWGLAALNVRTNHVHCVVLAARHWPERVMNDLKSWSTRRMIEAGVWKKGERPWSLHGSTKYLNAERSYDRAVVYTLYEQGPALPMAPPAGWKGPQPLKTPP